MIVSSRPLRVLHVDSGQEWQSVRDQVRLLVEGLRAEPGIRQAVATLATSRLAAECESLGVPVIPLPRTLGSDPLTLQQLARYVRGAWDLFHAHDGTALSKLLYIQALDGSNIPLVASRRYGSVPTAPDRWRRAALVIAASSPARDALLAAGVEPGRVVVVPNGIDPGIVVEEQTNALRDAIGARREHRLVASFTALSRHRDHETLLRAATLLETRCPEARFAVLGRGPERTRVEDLVEELELVGRVCLPGYLPDARRYMGDIDVFVMPAFDEELTSACLEAMVAGVPVVMPTASGIDAAAAEREPGPVRVPARDPEALASVLERLLADRGYYRASAERGRAFADRHGPAALVTRTRNVYERIARRRSAA